MGDFHDYNLETGINIKQEPVNESNIMITSASVPIPSRRDPPEYRDYIFDIDNSQSPLYGTIGLTTDQVLSPTNTYDIPGTYWGNRILTNDEMLKSEALIHMDEDDIFQVDKADLIQGPTLAELNANDENFLGDLNFDDLLLPNESSYTTLDSAPSYNYGSNFTNNNQMIGASSSCPQETLKRKKPGEGSDSSDSDGQTSHKKETATADSNLQNFDQIRNASARSCNSSVTSPRPSCSKEHNASVLKQHSRLQSSENKTISKLQLQPTTRTSKRNRVKRLREVSDYSRKDSQCPVRTKKIDFAGLMLYKDLNLPPGVTTSNYDVNSRTPVSALSPGSPASSSSSVVNSQTSPMHIHNLPPKHSTLHELLMKKDKFESSPDRSLLGQSVPSRNTPLHSPNVKMYRSNVSRLSSSAPTHLGLDQIWQRREPRKHLLSTSSMAECGSTSSLSTGGILSPDPQDFSHDEYESDEDSDGHYEDYSSDNNSDDDDEHTKASKKEKYFWQYNIQSKGPKGQRLVMKCKMENPHVLNEATDPVFSPDCSVRGIKHSGKARKGDGNDLTPNPRKLFNIGKELDKLGRIINDMTPVSELPFSIRPNSRKEKNKLASRACRLKKKAQHEANKIKLNGLEIEHRRYINTIQQIKQLITAKLGEPNLDTQEEISNNIEKMAKTCTKGKVAGHATEYVNKVLDKIKAGSSGNTALSTSFPDDL